MPEKGPQTKYLSIIAQGNASKQESQRMFAEAKDLQRRGHYTSADKLFNKARDIIAGDVYKGLAHGEVASVSVSKGKTAEGYDVVSISAEAANVRKLPKEFIADYRTATAMTAIGQGKDNQELSGVLAKIEARRDTTTTEEKKGTGLFGFFKKIISTNFDLAGQESAEEKAFKRITDTENGKINNVAVKLYSESEPTEVSYGDLQEAQRETDEVHQSYLNKLDTVHAQVREEKQSSGGWFGTSFGAHQERIIKIVEDNDNSW